MYSGVLPLAAPGYAYEPGLCLRGLALRLLLLRVAAGWNRAFPPLRPLRPRWTSPLTLARATSVVSPLRASRLGRDDGKSRCQRFTSACRTRLARWMNASPSPAQSLLLPLLLR